MQCRRMGKHCLPSLLAGKRHLATINRFSWQTPYLLSDELSGSLKNRKDFLRPLRGAYMKGLLNVSKLWGVNRKTFTHRGV